MNIIGISVLEELRKHKVFKDAIIAGGMCRDHILGHKFKDVDVFVPVVNERFFVDALMKIEGAKSDSRDFSFGNFKFSNKFDTNGYTSDGNYRGKFDGLYRDTIPVQIMSYRYNNIEKFPYEVVSEFNYHIDQIYWDGKELVVTPAANKDIKNGTATLCRLSGWDEMPSAMNKFNRLKEKYPNLKLKSLFQIVDPKGKEVKKEEYYEGAITSGNATFRQEQLNRINEEFARQAQQQAIPVVNMLEVWEPANIWANEAQPRVRLEGNFR